MVSENILQVLFLLSAFLVSAIATRYLITPDSKLKILDVPNERSLHSVPVSRTGGVAIGLGIVASLGLLGLFSDTALRWSQGSVTLAAAIIAIVSFLDDRKGLPALPRLASHFISMAIIMFSGFILENIQIPGFNWHIQGWAAWLLTAIFGVWLINLYNFMDGMDGFAGGMAVIGFGTLAAIGCIKGEHTYSIVVGCIGASAGGFLVFNFPPARIFMGDAGSSLLGFLVAFAIIWGSQLGIIPFWLAILVFSPFVVDASVTLLRRISNGEQIWRAHKSHYYQRLVNLGWSHRRAVLWEYGLMIFCSATAIFVTSTSISTATVKTIFMLWAFIYILLIITVNRLEKG